MTDEATPSVLVLGTGAQAKYVLEIFALLRITVVAVMSWDDEQDVAWICNYDVDVIPFDQSFSDAIGLGATHIIVCHPDPATKKLWFTNAISVGLNPISAIHPMSSIATTANIGNGVIINAGAVIQPLSTVKDGSMIHAGCIIEHDAVVGEYSNLAPGVKLAGWVSIGPEAIVYTGANLIPGIKVGARAQIAAGATVIRDVECGAFVAGVPAKVKKRSLP